MQIPPLSVHFQNREPSDIRVASIRYAARQDGVSAVNVAIGNVSLPMHPAMTARLHALGVATSPFSQGVVRYTSTRGLPEATRAFLRVIESSGFSTEGLMAQVTDGGSQAMELVIVGCCGPAGEGTKPLLLIDAAYTNYKAFAARLGRQTVSITRTLADNGLFTLPPLDEIELVILRERPGALVVIPYDNPTGQLYEQSVIDELARLCVKHNLWMISDEAYRELFYTGGNPPSIWGISDKDVPGIRGRRISIETASKVFNGCGLRIGGLITDSDEFSVRAEAENTASLCSSAVGQYVFGALAELSDAELHSWYDRQRNYYRLMLNAFHENVNRLIPGAIVSRPDASIYAVVDLRRIVPESFDAYEFVLWCAEHGVVLRGDERLTLLTAPMAGFYSSAIPNPGRTQLRIAFVEAPERMALVPELLARLLERYLVASK